MVRFLSKLIGFIIPILCGFITLEFLVREIPNDYTLKHSNLLIGDIEVLTLGNSHLMFGVNPDLMNYKTFNASLPAQTMKIDLGILNSYKDHFNDLKYIIIPVDYYSFYAKLENGNNSQRRFRYEQFMDLSLLSGDDYLNFAERAIVLEKGLRSTFSSIGSYFIESKTNVSCETNGYYKAEGQEDLEKSGMIHSKLHNEYYPSSNYNDILEDLRKIIKIAQENSWKVLLVNSPAWETYRRHLYPDRINNINANCLSLVDENEHVYYVDFFTSKSFLSTDYYDSSHLGVAGAEKLTKALNCLIELIDNGHISYKYISDYHVIEDFSFQYSDLCIK